MQRSWDVHPEDVDELTGSALDMLTILLRCGGVGSMAPHRVENEDGVYVVERVRFKYDSYAPGLNRPKDGEAETTEQATTEEDQPTLAVVDDGVPAA